VKTATIEELLTWAFVHELPKGGGVEGLANPNSAWRTIYELGTRVQNNRVPGSGGSENYFIEQGEPAPDAEAVAYAVRGLARLDVVIDEGWSPLADWPPLPPAGAFLVDEAVEHALAHYRSRPVETRREAIVTIVAGTACLGKMPDFSAEPSRVRMVERGGMPAWFVHRQTVDANGATVVMEVDGRNPRTRKPFAGAYRKYELSHDPLGDILGRLDYQIWVAALRWLEREVGPQLVAHRVAACDRSMTPWLDRDAGGVALTDPSTKKKRAAPHIAA
jgi:hypothetical protein